MRQTKPGQPKRGRRVTARRGRIDRPPRYIWADCDPQFSLDLRWSFYRTLRDQRGVRPDLKPIKLRVSLA